MKKIILIILAACFINVANAQDEKTDGYKAAEKFCKQFDQKPTKGTTQNHAFSYEKEINHTGSQYHAGGNLGGNVGGSTGVLKAQINGDANLQRTSERTDTKDKKIEYYDCK